MIEHMNNIVKTLNNANQNYYNTSNTTISDKEYDDLYDELLQLEKETGIVLSNSPSQKVGVEVLSKLEKETLEYPMLSLDKTKLTDELKSFLKDKVGMLSYKLDGLSCQLTYENGMLTRATTRGNGQIGSNCLHHVKQFQNIPMTIPYKDKLVIRGESVIKTKSFEEINIDGEFKNARNLVSGTLNSLDSSITKNRKVNFVGYAIIEGLNAKTKHERLDMAQKLGFEIVPYSLVTKDNIEDSIMKDYEYGIDGNVLTFDDISYSNSLSNTSKFPLDSIAFKFYDEEYETTLLNVEWQTSRSSWINPVAVFEPVDIDGSTIERATLHNLDYIEELELGIGDTITIIKCNQVIPKVLTNLTRSNTLEIPKTCPSCGYPTEIKRTKTSKVLLCNNPNCQAKLITNFTHYVSRDCANIDGLSEATLEKFIEKGFLKRFSDIYSLAQYQDIIMKMDGFGKKSYDKLISSIEKSKSMNISNFIKALGIENVGNSTGKLIAKHFKNDVYKIFTYDYRLQDELAKIDGIGEITAKAYALYLMKNQEEIIRLMEFVSFDVGANMSSESSVNVKDKNFVVTGEVNHFKNRKELQAKIESLGGKIVGSVSKNTDYLINNDKNSPSSKNKKAQELGVNIISEEDFLKMI